MSSIKRKILFVIDSLSIGGAEKSLTTLLSMLDYSRYDVDLQLSVNSGSLLEFIPPQVRILPEIPYLEFLRKNLKEQLLTFNPIKLIPGFVYSYISRRRQPSPIAQSCLYWKCVKRCVERNNQQYDVAIAYGQGLPTFYVVDKVKAHKKFAWVNACYSPTGKSQKYLKKYYDTVDKIIPVSDGVKNILSEIYPEYINKMYVIWDIVNPELILKMSESEAKIKFDNTKPTIITLSRLDKGDKGMDITLQVAKILKDRGLNASWHILGHGPYFHEMKKFISENHLSDFLYLDGPLNNPYPYLKEATIYVQTSRAEGFGLSLAEARLLNKPIVTTPYNGVENQIVPNRNGIVASFSPEDIADKIIRLLADRDMYDQISNNLMVEKKGNIEEIEKIYSLLG